MTMKLSEIFAAKRDGYYTPSEPDSEGSPEETPESRQQAAEQRMLETRISLVDLSIKLINANVDRHEISDDFGPLKDAAKQLNPRHVTDLFLEGEGYNLLEVQERVAFAQSLEIPLDTPDYESILTDQVSEFVIPFIAKPHIAVKFELIAPHNVDVLKMPIEKLCILLRWRCVFIFASYKLDFLSRIEGLPADLSARTEGGTVAQIENGKGSEPAPDTAPAKSAEDHTEDNVNHETQPAPAQTIGEETQPGEQPEASDESEHEAVTGVKTTQNENRNRKRRA